MKIPRRFRDVEQASYVLIGFIPYLLALYLVVSQDIEVTASVLGVAALALVAHLIGFSVIRKFGRHLKTVRDSTGKALSSKLRTTIEVEKDTPDELSDIVNSFNVMLRESQQAARNFQEMTTKMMLYSRDIEKYQKRLREEGLSRHRLSRYVGQDLVNKIVNSNEETPLQNKRQMATILFADIRSFTTISEDMEPETLINMLNEYFDAMVNIIFKHYGVLDKFVGDELMATFGLLDSVENGPINSLKAAIEMQNSMKSLMDGFKKKGYPVFEIGIGINCGDVVMGNLGSKNRMDYTVIGDTVNVAARLEQMAGGGDILAGEAVHDRCGHLVTMRPKGAIQVKNRVQPVQCYQVMT
ncbi:MAG: adenylate/guanylate cyclase domain-containing protein [Mariprofundus sp.]